MNLKDAKLVLLGAAGLIGSHTVDRLLKEDVREILIYDNSQKYGLTPEDFPNVWTANDCRVSRPLFTG
jgi:nucleoside-diphosphate-sugar epimerase